MPIMQSVFYLPIQINVLRTWLSCVQVDTSLENITYCAGVCFLYDENCLYQICKKSLSKKCGFPRKSLYVYLLKQ